MITQVLLGFLLLWIYCIW